jgi:haloalkane dehalogenase
MREEIPMPDDGAVPAWLDHSDYPFTAHRAQLREGHLHYVDEGHGPPVVFSHGTPTWSFEFRHIIRTLAPAWRCIAPDHLGFGLSDRPASASYTPEAHALRFREFVDHLGLSRFSLVVHDYGGPIALPMALDGRVDRLVLLNTWMWSFADDAEMRKRGRMVSGALGRFLYRHMNASLRLLTPSAYGDRRKLTPRIHRHYLEPFTDPASRVRVLWPLARALLGSSSYYDSLWERRARLTEIPVLIVWGLKDSAFRPNQLHRWQEALPTAKVVMIAEAGHWPHEEAPSEVAEAIQKFLQEGRDARG